MTRRITLVVAMLLLVLTVLQVQVEAFSFMRSRQQDTRATGETTRLILQGNLTALRNNDSSSLDEAIWVLIPTGSLNGSSDGGKDQFELFKLNTDRLLVNEQQQVNGGPSGGELDGFVWPQNSDEHEQTPSHQPSTETSSPRRLGREARKMKFFPNFMRKPKVSPLYLVNGTVCRFVNTQPVCTTLSTTGLFGGKYLKVI